jgi:hypothetical protein
MLGDAGHIKSLRHCDCSHIRVRCIELCAAVLLVCPAAHALSVLTHEAIIDSTWTDGIRPLLVKRFPQASADDLRQARAFAYGGCIIQDMGYYPFGSKLYTDLAHYVRSGDFVVNLLVDAQTLDEYAFALGALAHYATDNAGHPLAVNPSVGLEYPKLRRKFGPIVTYADDPGAHLKVEFGFDVEQVARGSYAAAVYHDFIGFQVAKPLLERAFEDTYGVPLKDIFGSLDLALGTYRYTVSTLVPAMTRAAWKLHKNDLVRASPGLTQRRFIYTLSRASYRKEWGNGYRHAGFGLRVLSFFLRILPKVGPLKVAEFKPPTPRATADFERAFSNAVQTYRGLLAESAQPGFHLSNRDFDTGKPTAPCEYPLADDTYARLAILLAGRDAAQVNPQVRADVLAFYRNPDLPFHTRKNSKEWRRTMDAVERLRTGAKASGSEARPLFTAEQRKCAERNAEK